MNDNPAIRSYFEQRYMRLLFDLYPLEHGWRRFEAIWSDDDGLSRVRSEFRKHCYEGQCRDLTTESVLETLNEVRTHDFEND